MIRTSFLSVFLFVFPLLSNGHAAGQEPVTLSEAVTEDMTLSGEVVIAGDLLIPRGVTVTLLAGTEVRIVPSEGTRTIPQFLSTGTEITVHGRLAAPEGHVRFAPEGSIAPGSWGGIYLTSPGSEVSFNGVTVVGAAFGLAVMKGTADVTGSTFELNEVGLASTGQGKVTVSRNRFRSNGIASASLFTGTPITSGDDRFEGNGEDALALDTPAAEVLFKALAAEIPSRPPVTREYLGEMALDEDTVWSGTVVIDGQVAVPPDVRLTIEPGTHVLFSFRDTNRDGLGESWIIVQGSVRVLGEEDAWVLFDAEGPDAVPGAWDSLSIIASDAEDNLIRYALFRRGGKAFHTHFSRSHLDHVVFEDNLRGIQFQESEETIIDWVYLTGNQSAMRFRDSTVKLSNIVAEDNISGINFLRARVDLSDVVVSGSPFESLVSRESETVVNRAVFTGNRRGPRFRGEGEPVRIHNSAIWGNLTEGLSLNNVKADVSRSHMSQNGFTGLSVTDAEVKANLNVLSSNGRFAVDNNGSTAVDARANDWGTGGPPKSASIYDGADEEGIGPVLTDRPASFALAFPGMGFPAGSLSGDLLVIGDVTTPPERTLTFVPGATMRFARIEQDSLFDLQSDHPFFPGSELIIQGSVEAAGTIEAPISFQQEGLSSAEGAMWGSVNLTGGKGGRFEYCVFTGASTGIHAREAQAVSIRNSSFQRNQVGLRFSRTAMDVRSNLFRGNGTGVRFHEFGGTVQGNTFERNNSAVFVTGNPKDVFLKDNTFRDNTDYHVKLGIHVSDDVTVEGGDFVIPEGKTAADLVFDGQDEEELGRVILNQKAGVRGQDHK
jgi:hypothetical protein